MGGATAGTMLALHGTKIELLGWISYSTLMHCNVQCEISITDVSLELLSFTPDPTRPGKDKIEFFLVFTYNQTCACWGGSPQEVGEFDYGLGTCTVEGATVGNQWKIDFKIFAGVGAEANPPPENLEVDSGSWDLTEEPRIDPAKCNQTEVITSPGFIWAPTGQTMAMWLYFNGQPIGNQNNVEVQE